MSKRFILSVVVCMALTIYAAGADLDGEISKVFAELKSGDKEKMTDAKRQLERLRPQVVSGLSAILVEQDKTQINLQWAKRDALRNVVIELLGKMRAEESIDLIIANVSPPAGVPRTSDAVQSSPVAVDALARIGKAATPKILEKMAASVSDEERRALGLALIHIEGFDGGNDLLQSRIRSERDETRRKQFEAVQERYLRLPKTLPPPGYDE